MLEHPLDDAASVWMSGKVVYLTVESIDDELDVLSRHTLDGLLDDVVTILVLDAL